MTTHTPLARYSATNGALVSGFATAELHHLMGHDLGRRLVQASLEKLSNLGFTHPVSGENAFKC
ncbi:hypothetical protein NKK52_30155 [Mesorhizobium sp. C277A]|uniref:hypothetical protein n=1 Tax=Mesorhizobium sp. C277A TaxID=2956827 RepID=UPI0012EB594A